MKPAAELSRVTLSHLARNGSGLMLKLLEQSSAVSVTVQGQDALVAMPQRQYDEMLALIAQARRSEPKQDPFSAALTHEFDELVGTMNRPGADVAINAALFGDASSLNETYRAGKTETDS